MGFGKDIIRSIKQVLSASKDIRFRIMGTTTERSRNITDAKLTEKE
tara:strand:- start:936 stop:1073 length:138 start_codon:yes stop_codon:yes gene_type:complete